MFGYDICANFASNTFLSPSTAPVQNCLLERKARMARSDGDYIYSEELILSQVNSATSQQESTVDPVLKAVVPQSSMKQHSSSSTKAEIASEHLSAHDSRLQAPKKISIYWQVSRSDLGTANAPVPKRITKADMEQSHIEKMKKIKNNPVVLDIWSKILIIPAKRLCCS